MLDLGTLQAHLKIDGAEQATKDLSDASKEAEKTDKSFRNKLLEGVGKIALGFASLSSAVKDVTQKLKGLLDDTAAYGDEIDKQSQKMGISAGEYQRWSYVLERNGADINSLQIGMKTLNKQIDGNSEAFGELGVSLTDASGNMRSTEDILNDTMQALAGVEDEQKRTSLATELFGGKVAQELLPTLNSGADGIEDLKNRADELGLVMSDDGVKASAEYQDAITDLNGTIEGIKRTVIEELLPVVTSVINWVTDEAIPAVKDFIDNNNWLIPAITGVVGALTAFKAAMGITAIIQGAITAWNAFKTANEGATIAQWLFNAALNANPIVLVITLIAGLVTAIGTLLLTNEDFRKKVGEIWEGVKQTVKTVIDAIVKFFTVTLPNGIQAGIKWFAELPGRIWKAIGNVAKTIFDKGAEIVKGFLDGVKQKWEDLKQWFADLPSNILKGIGNLGKTLWNAGVDIIGGFFKGLKEKWEGVKNWFGGIGKWIQEHKGPKEYDLKLLIPNGGWIMESLMTGLERSKPALLKELNSIGEMISGTNFNANYAFDANGSGVASSGNSYNIYINGTRINDDIQIENKFSELLNTMARKGMM